MTKLKDRRAKEKTSWLKQSGAIKKKPNISVAALEWFCANCGMMNDAEEWKCFNCGELKNG